MLGVISRVTLSLAITVAGIVTACHPVMPTPAAPELSRESPRPPKIDPGRRKDGGVAPSSFGHADMGHRERVVRVADVPVDAGVSDVMTLPPVPDADSDMLRDAGRPFGD